MDALPHLPVGQQAESEKRPGNEWCSGARSYIPEFCRAGNCMMSCGFGPIRLQEAFYSILVDIYKWNVVNPHCSASRPEQVHSQPCI